MIQEFRNAHSPSFSFCPSHQGSHDLQSRNRFAHQPFHSRYRGIKAVLIFFLFPAKALLLLTRKKPLARRYNIRYNSAMTTLKLTSIGNSTGVILPKELLEKLRVSKGDTLTVTETPRGLELSAYDQEFSEAMNVAEEVMREDRDVLRKLGQ